MVFLCGRLEMLCRLLRIPLGAPTRRSFYLLGLVFLSMLLGLLGLGSRLLGLLGMLAQLALAVAVSFACDHGVLDDSAGGGMSASLFHL